MENLSAKSINEMFVANLQSQDGINKVAQEGSTFIRQKLREASFARKILPPQYVTKDDLTRSVNHDGLVKITDIEPDSRAMVVTFRGNPTAEYVVGERFEIPFFQVSSPDFQKTEEELLAYEMPLTDVIEKNSVLDIQKIEDTSFLGQCDQAIAVEVALGNTTANTGTYDATTGAIPKTSLKTLFDILDGNQLESRAILMDRKMFNRLFLWDATTVGDAVGSQVYVNGHTYSTLFGRRLVVSNKTDLLDNKIYVFTDPEFFGQFLVLQDTQFWLEKKKNIVTWAAWETLGMGIGNTKAVGKLTLS